jgi:phospholipid/cholesterol/gamma-HCH transport system permease protein
MERAGESLVLGLSGDWKLGGPLPTADAVEGEMDARRPPARVAFATGTLGAWDSALVAFLVDVKNICMKRHIDMDKEGLPEGAQRLLGLASAVPEARQARREKARPSPVAQVGEKAMEAGASVLGAVAFLGDVTASLGRMAVGSARFRSTDLWLTIQESGSRALLVGLILAFVGSIQLKVFGAQIYVADLVGIAMVRAMGAIMAGIIMAGRTGASFAAQIGTMQVNEEIDALKTSAIPPIDFLVLPRVVALALMMPLLTLYADLMGIIGGMIVGITGLQLSPEQYFTETKHAVTLTNVWIGLFSGFVFGVLIALAGCLRGMQCGRSASAVGDATRSAVVTGIVSIIVATAIITVVCDVLGI